MDFEKFILTVTILAVGSILYGVYLWRFFRTSKTPEERQVEKLRKMLPKAVKQTKVDLKWNRLYFRLNNIPFIRTLLDRMTLRLKIIYAGSMKEVRPRAAKYVVLSVSASIVMILFSVFMFDKIYTQICVIMGSMYAISVINNLLISQAYRKLLSDLIKLFQLVRSEYQQSRMVIGSLRSVAEATKGLVSIHANKIADILESLNPDHELDLYYEVAPNRHLKQFAGVALNTYKNGDTDRPSAFLTSIRDLIEEVRLEALTRDKLADKMNMVSFIAIFPAFMLEWMRNWSETNFETMPAFYSGQIGNYALWLILICFPFSFYVLELIKHLSEDTSVATSEGRFVKRILKYRWASKYIGRVAPAHRSSKRSILIDNSATKLLNNASSTLSVKELYAQKILNVAIVFIIALVAQSVVIVSSKASVFDIKSQVKIVGMEPEVLEAKNNFEISMRDNILSAGLEGEAALAIIDQNLGMQATVYSPDKPKELYEQEVLDKIQTYDNLYFKWFNMLFAGLCGVAGFWIPNLVLYFKAFLRKAEMQFEVDGYYSVLLLLKSFDRMMVIELIEEMFRYSRIFRRLLSECMLNYDSGPVKSLEILGARSGFEPLSRISERLKVAADLVSIKDAFDDLEDDRKESIERRKMSYEKLLDFRGTLALWVCMVPTVASLALYMVLPMFYVVSQQSATINEIIK